jgi:hypothetical protein
MSLSLFALLLSLPAVAQDEPADDGRRVRYAERTVVDFEIVEVGGSIDGPSISYVQAPPRKGFNPMIRVRESFDAEILSSVDEVQ